MVLKYKDTCNVIDAAYYFLRDYKRYTGRPTVLHLAHSLDIVVLHDIIFDRIFIR